MEEKLLCHIIIHPQSKPVSRRKIIKQIKSAYEWDAEKGPVICFCNANAYEYLVRNNLDQILYLDVIVSDSDINEEKAKELIGGDGSIEFEYPFLTPFMDEEKMDLAVESLPEKYSSLCLSTISKEHNLSAL
jgi:hypothetical protein